MTTARLLLDCRNAHGEGIFWDIRAGRAYWTDIDGRFIWSFDPVTGEASCWPLSERLCCFAPRTGGGFVAGFASGFAFFGLEPIERIDLAAFEPGTPQTRLNDGRPDRQGRFVAGGMDEVGLAPISSVQRLNLDRSVSVLLEGVRCANSLCFSPDGRTMYFGDSPTGVIEAFDYDQASGEVGTRRPFARVREPGVPDGSCVDSEGFLWNAVWEGYRVDRWSPDGHLDRSIDIPVRKPTCCTFGGPGLDWLFVTTSRQGERAAALSAEPTAGGLFGLRPGPRGLPDAPFAR
jgi:L-arabinonolactonase